MKKLLTLSILLFSFSTYAQSSLEIQKAKTAVIAYLKRNLNNPASYSPASWGKLEKTYSSFYDTKVAEDFKKTLQIYHDGKIDLLVSISKIKARIGKNYESDSTYIDAINLQNQATLAYDSLYKAQQDAEKSYKPKFDGYSIEHSIRARNKFNALVLQNYIFILNKTFKVISSGDTDEMERERADLQRRIDELTKGNN